MPDSTVPVSGLRSPISDDDIRSEGDNERVTETCVDEKSVWIGVEERQTAVLVR